MAERRVAVARGGLNDGPDWELLEDHDLSAYHARCPHCRFLPDGTWVLPRGLLACTDGGLGATVLCYDCVRLAVQTHCPDWEEGTP